MSSRPIRLLHDILTSISGTFPSWEMAGFKSFGAFTPQDTISKPSSRRGPEVDRSSNDGGRYFREPGRDIIPIRTSASESHVYSTPAHGYSNSAFAVIPDGSQHSVISQDGSASFTEQDCPHTGRKGSRSSVEELRNIGEFRSIEKKAGQPRKGRPRRPPNGVPQAKKPHARLVSNAKDLAHDPISDDDELAILDDQRSAHFGRRRGTTTSSGPVDLTADDTPPGKQQMIINISACEPERRKRLRDDDVDELNDDNYPQQKKRFKAQDGDVGAGRNKSLSSRGDIKPSFSQRPEKTNAVQSVASKPQFNVKRAVCDPNHFCESHQILATEAHASEKTSEQEPTLRAVLSTSRPSPLQSHDSIPGPHEWLFVAVSKLRLVDHNLHSPYVIIRQMKYGNLGGKMALEFSDSRVASRFVDWVKQSRGDRRYPQIQSDVELATLEKKFDVAFQAVLSAQQSREKHAVEGPADDVMVMEHNAGRRHSAATTMRLNGESKSSPVLKRTLRDRMEADPEPVVVDGNDGREAKRPNLESSRALRSMPASSEPIFTTRTSHSPRLVLWTQENPDWDKEWRRDLTYGRTTIHKQDIARLDDGEFLNDNIISFYLHYLHEKLKLKDKTTAARFYFHNSFFYERLKPTKGKTVNYDSVKSWTSRVDIFSYDFIVVPVNENNHWWLAVICNPGQLLCNNLAKQVEAAASRSLNGELVDARDSSIDAGRGMNEVSVDPENSSKNASRLQSPGASPRTTNVTTDMRRMSLGQSDKPSSKELEPITIDDGADGPKLIATIPDDEAEEPLLVVSDLKQPDKTGKPKKSKGKESLVDVEKEPRIITLDSLGSSHSPACTHLKQYLSLELKHKKSHDVDMPTTFGHTAKTIPLQTNFWDCGVYLLSYMEALMQDPDAFVRGILLKEEPTWTVEASSMRNVIRSVILEEHAVYQQRQDAEAIQKQEKKRRKKERTVGSIAGSSQHTPNSEAEPPQSSSPSALMTPKEDIVPSIERGSFAADSAVPS